MQGLTMGWFAVVIALLAALIAFGQLWTARQKLILDLFEKRFQVYLDVRRIASAGTQLGRLEDPGLANELLARGRFLFGRDVVKALEELHTLTINLEMKEPSAAAEINKHFKAMVPLFEPYLGMQQRLPLSVLKRWLRGS
jgi:hypothetical protein